MSRGLVRIFRAKITGVEADFVDFDREGECEIFCGFFVGFVDLGGLPGRAGNERFLEHYERNRGEVWVLYAPL